MKCGIYFLLTALPALPLMGQEVRSRIGFTQDLFESSASVEFRTPIQIDPVPTSGVFSYGLVCSVEGDNGLVGIVTMEPANDLSFDGPLGPGVRSIRAENGNFAAKGSVDVLDTDQPKHLEPTLGSLVIAGLPDGEYILRLAAYNTLGPTETIFVDGLCRPLDPLLDFGTAALRISSEAEGSVTALSEYRADRQTGLLLRDYEIKNTGLIAATFRVFIDDLPDGTTVWNSHGTVNGRPYIDVPRPINPGESVMIRIEFRSADRATIPSPTFVVGTAAALEPVVPQGLAVSLQPRATLARGEVLLEFSSTLGKNYYIQYSDDMAVWKSALPKVIGTGSRIQWIDNGLPKTDPHPSTVSSRFYRILEAAPSP